jgi:hypothetical protein
MYDKIFGLLIISIYPPSIIHHLETPKSTKPTKSTKKRNREPPVNIKIERRRESLNSHPPSLKSNQSLLVDLDTIHYSI